jgi:hypothetical protein
MDGNAGATRRTYRCLKVVWRSVGRAHSAATAGRSRLAGLRAPPHGQAQIALPGRITLTNRYVWCGSVQDG